MSTTEIEMLIGYLGKSHAELVNMNVVSGTQLLSLFPGSETIFLSLVDGLDMTFSPENKIFTKLFITLKESTPSTTDYEGTLPAPLVKDMTKSLVYELFGSPKSAHAPVQLPPPTGWTGGWDCYDYDENLFPGVDLIFQYTAEMEVDTVVFRKLI